MCWGVNAGSGVKHDSVPTSCCALSQRRRVRSPSSALRSQRRVSGPPLYRSTEPSTERHLQPAQAPHEHHIHLDLLLLLLLLLLLFLLVKQIVRAPLQSQMITPSDEHSRYLLCNNEPWLFAPAAASGILSLDAASQQPVFPCSGTLLNEWNS